MIQHKFEIVINKPLEEVIELFRNRDNLPKWQPGLLSSELLETSPYPKYKLLLQIGRRKMVMTETILVNNLPRNFEGTYVLKGVINHVRHSFESTGPRTTKWTSHIEFRFKGVMKLVALFMKSDFYKQSSILMSNFKKYAEFTR